MKYLTSTKGIGFKKELKSKREYKKVLIDKNYNFEICITMG